MLEKEIYKLGEKMNKPQVRKFDRIEKSLNDNIAMIESILEGLKSDFNYIKICLIVVLKRKKELLLIIN